MNCRRVQRLIPLHVEGDLRTNTAEEVVSHLEWCGRCNWLADEFRESQGWLRSAKPPEFDEAMLDDFKQGVLKRVEETPARSSLFAALAQQFNRRQILALSTTFLILLGVVVVYFYQAKGKETRPMISKAESTAKEELETAVGATQPGLEAAPEAKSRSVMRHNFRRVGRKGSSHPMIAKRGSERTPAFPMGSLPGIAPIEKQNEVSDAVGRSREMLRIEIQTGDPSIRIIWFAPKETDLHQSKPATD